MKNALIAALVLIVIGLGWYIYSGEKSEPAPVPEDKMEAPQNDQASTTSEEMSMEDKTRTVLGKSVGDHDILAYHYGEGDKEVLFIGGLHGGYSWNTTLLAYELMDYLSANPSTIPAGMRVTVIPVANPDGLARVVADPLARFTPADVAAKEDMQIAGRTNGAGVDLNRNYDCDWKATGNWKNTPVSGGSAPFSEPESIAIRDYIQQHSPEAVVAWFSAAGGVYASSCNNGISAETKALTNEYARAAGYPAHENWDAYTVNGDVTNWLAKIKIPAISVVLTTHDDAEWSRNLKGIQAVFTSLSK